MPTRYYSSTAGAMTLNADVAAVDNSISVNSTVGLPTSFPYTLIIDPGGAEEIVSVTAASGGILTVTRGEDGSSAQAHSLGNIVRHGFSARDLRESRAHEDLTANVHGRTGTLVGTSDTQVLTNKDLSSATNTFPSSLATDAEVTTAVNNHAAVTATHGATGAVVGTTNTQTLTNKTISGSSNTLSNIPQSAVTNLSSDQTSQNTRLTNVENRATALESDTGWVTTGFVMGSGYTNINSGYRNLGGTFVIYIAATRTAATITGNSSNGSLPDEIIITVPTAVRPNAMMTGAGSLSIGGSGGASMPYYWRFDVDGTLKITATAPGLNITSGTTFFASMTWIK